MMRLALLAVLLMALAPTVTRLVTAGNVEARFGWSELCTRQGLQWVYEGDGALDGKSSMPVDVGMGGDCGYCTLPLAPPLRLVSVDIRFPSPATPAATPIVTPARFATVPLRGLGGQGPPLES